jgi:hypothetical protein
MRLATHRGQKGRLLVGTWAQWETSTDWHGSGHWRDGVRMRVVIVRMRRLLIWCRWPWSCPGRWGPSRLGHRSCLPRPGAFPGRQHASGGLRGRRSWGLFSWGQHLQRAVSPCLRAPVVLRRERTVYTRAVEDLAGFTRRACAVALDLELRLARLKRRNMQRSTTFRFRQLLQFMASLGSLETRRAGSRSMPI